MARPAWFLSTAYQCATDRLDFVRLRAERHGSQGPAGACVSLLSGETLWSMPEPEEERFRTLDEMLGEARPSAPAPAAAVRSTIGPARSAVLSPTLSRRGRRSRPVIIWGRDLPPPTAYVYGSRQATGPNTLTLNANQNE